MTAEIDDAGRAPCRRQHRIQIADGEDAAAAHRDRLRGRMPLVHGQHVGVDEHGGRLRRSSRHLSHNLVPGSRPPRSAAAGFGDRAESAGQDQ
jgi:hypothetical protein